jgi:hypothetical protein
VAHTLFASVNDLVKQAWATIGHAVSAMIRQFHGDEQDPKLDAGIGRHAAIIAQTALNNGQTLEIIDRDPDGHMFSLRTSYEGNVRVLSREAIQRGKLEEYRDCRVRDIMTSQPAIRAEIPMYGNALIRCTYERGLESEFGDKLHVGEHVTILGSPIWSDRKNDDLLPEYIELAIVINANHEYIGRPKFQLLTGELDDLFTA